MEPQKKRTFKNLLYEQFARVGKALASPHRLELLDVLAQGERSVEVLAQETGMPIASASQHLQVLRTARLVETRREGVTIYYRLASEEVLVRVLARPIRLRRRCVGCGSAKKDQDKKANRAPAHVRRIRRTKRR